MASFDEENSGNEEEQRESMGRAKKLNYLTSETNW